MSNRLYRVLLAALPRQRRARFGDDMAAVFVELSQQARQTGGAPAVLMLWIREAWGMVRFACREWRSALAHRLGLPRGQGPGMGTELKWAWRGVRARGGPGLLSAALLAIVLAVNAIVFAVTDSLVFHRAPYPHPERIVTLSHKAEPPEVVRREQAAALLEAWRHEKTVFTAVGGYLRKSVFLTGSTYERVSAADLTIGTLEVLGARPRWGRAFTEADLRDPSVLPALMGERLAQRRFGKPERALGQRVEATGMPLVIVGVMSNEFAFPQVGFQLWRGIDPAGPMTRNFGGVFTVARLAPSVDLTNLPAILSSRAARVGQAAGLSSYGASATPYVRAGIAGSRRQILLVLSGAGLCLLLVACANVSGIELAHGVRRARSLTLHAALGASRARICRLVGLEGVILVGSGVAGALVLTWMVVPTVAERLPQSIGLATENPISFDGRVLWFMAAAAVLSWILAAVPAVAAAARPRLLTFLALDGRTASASRTSTHLRQTLTLVQVAVAVVLVVGGLLYIRTYRELLQIDKGFDTSGLATVTMSMPSDVLASRDERSAMIGRLLGELRQLPGVVGASSSGAPPSLGDSPSKVNLEVDGQPVPETILLGRKWIDTGYFDVTRLPLREGRYLQLGDAPTDVVVSETFARRFWPDDVAVGRSFKDVNKGWFEAPHRVIGVVADFRTSPRTMPAVADDRFYVYALPPSAQPGALPAGPSPPGPRPIDTGGSYRFLDIMVRIESPAVLPDVLSAVQRVDPRMQTKAQFVDDIYADQHADVLLATRVIGGFGIVAFITAMAGLFGVMSFLVASRTREIGIRMALGATAHDIVRMVFASSGVLVIAGALIGVAAAAWASKWIEAQLYGISPTDPATYIVVSLTAIATATVATWRPARQAARVDPAVTLRAE